MPLARPSSRPQRNGEIKLLSLTFKDFLRPIFGGFTVYHSAEKMVDNKERMRMNGKKNITAADDTFCEAKVY